MYNSIKGVILPPLCVTIAEGNHIPSVIQLFVLSNQ